MMMLGLSALLMGANEIFNSKVDVHYEYWKQYGRAQVIRSIEMQVMNIGSENASSEGFARYQFMSELVEQLRNQKGWPQ